MRCRFPIDAWQEHPGAKLVFDDVLAERHNFARVTIPCGRCVSCRLARSRFWAIRILHEAKLYGVRNVFVTLTYRDDTLPQFGSLQYRDFQLFMKRLRRAGYKSRFYVAGEYGENTLRPHYHAILFNTWFADMKYWRMSDSGFKLYRSAELEKLWALGNCEIGLVTFESAAYCARYVMSKVTGDRAKSHYEVIDASSGEVSTRVPEFNRMSLKPGIGHEWLKRFMSDVYPHGKCVVNGVEVSPPRYYDKVFAATDDAAWQALRESREFSASLRAFDNTVERRAVKAVVEDAKLKLLHRG